MYNTYYMILIVFVPILFHASLVNAINNSVGDQNEFWKEVKNIVNGLSNHHLIEFHQYLQIKMDESARHDCVTCFQVCLNLNFLNPPLPLPLPPFSSSPRAPPGGGLGSFKPPSH